MTDQSRTDSSSRADTRGRPESPAPDEDSAYAGHTAAGARAADTADLNSLLVNSLQDYAVFALDRAGHILTWNEGAARIKGYTASEITGRHFSIFYPPEDVAAGLPLRALAPLLELPHLGQLTAHLLFFRPLEAFLMFVLDEVLLDVHF